MSIINILNVDSEPAAPIARMVRKHRVRMSYRPEIIQIPLRSGGGGTAAASIKDSRPFTVQDVKDFLDAMPPFYLI